MVDLAPKLNSGVAFNQPVQTPNAMSAIADLFNFGASTLRSSGDGPKPTEDEKFAVAVRQFEEEKGASFQWDRKGMREFIFKYPQFTDQAKGFGENLGVMIASPQEAARDSLTDWAQTPEGIEAAARASQFEDPAEGDAYMAQRMTEQKVQEAEIAKLKRNTEKLTLEGTLETEQWKALGPAQKTAVDTAIDVYFKDIFDEVTTKGTTIQISPEQQQMLGINYNSVSLDNLPAVLYDIKRSMETRARDNYRNTFGKDSLPSEDWNKQVFASIDNLITGAEKFDTPEEKANFMKGLIQSEAYKTLDEAGLAVSVEIFKSLPSEAAAMLYPQLSGMTGALADVLNDNGSIASGEKLKLRIEDLGKNDANTLAEETIQVIESGGLTPEFFTAFKEAAKRGGHNVVDSASYKALVGNNIDKIKSTVASDPAFREEFGQWITSDIQQTISAVQSNLPAGLVISTQGNKFIVTAGEDFNWSSFEAMNKVRVNGGQEPISIQQYIQDNMPSSEGLNVDALNQKVATLNLLGEFGKEVQGAIGMLNTDTKATNSRTSPRGGPRGRGRGRVDPQDVISGLQSRDIPSHIAEGFAMNIADESGFDTGINEANPIVEGSRGGFGLIQWTGPRRRALEAFAVEQGKPVDDLDMQLDFLVQELGGTESAAWKRISAASTKEEAAALILNEFLRPAESHRASREAKYLGGAGGFEARGAGSAPKDVPAPSTLSVRSDSASVDTASLQGASNTPVQSLGGTVEALNAPEVQQIVEKAQEAPEEALKLAKEVLSKPIDPSVKALIEALVKIGERA